MTEEIKRRRIAIGGLMRCCLHSIQELEDGKVREISCKYCNEKIVIRNSDGEDVWHWAGLQSDSENYEDWQTMEANNRGRGR